MKGGGWALITGVLVLLAVPGTGASGGATHCQSFELACRPLCERS